MSQKRHQARIMAMQALYQWQLMEQAPTDICRQFIEREENKGYSVSYFQQLVTATIADLPVLDASLTPLLGRSIASLDPVERAIVRLGTYELTHALEVPYRVVINEWVEIAKGYGAEQGHRFVNGVLDKLVPELRTTEVGAS
jgi:N utilization substance protein B